jgi:hypothetical protein
MRARLPVGAVPIDEDLAAGQKDMELDCTRPSNISAVALLQELPLWNLHQGLLVAVE